MRDVCRLIGKRDCRVEGMGFGLWIESDHTSCEGPCRAQKMIVKLCFNCVTHVVRDCLVHRK
jgi:hypothetical protein